MAGLIFRCGGDGYYNISTFQGKPDDHVKAIESFLRATEENPNDAEVYFIEVYSQKTQDGNREEVTSDYSKSLELNPRYYEAYRNPHKVNLKIKQT